MAESFDLIVAADSENSRIDLRLMSTGGVQIAARTVDFRPLPLSKKQALFDLRSYLRLYVEKGQEEESVARTGVFLAEDILGREIFLKLWSPQSQRSLRVQLPRAKEEGNPLGAALTRIPWEIARPSPKHQTLGERNLLIRVVHEMDEPPTRPIDLGKDGSLRVLFVFAEARRSQPLSVRRERREIEHLFKSEIYPNRKIVVDFLTHGVTRERLREQVKNRSGYHVVHWSGHGHANLLELSGVRGLADHFSGEELVQLFAEAGGFLPQLVFLSACQSGDVQQVKNWQSFLSAARGDEPGTRGVAPWDGHPGRDIDIEVQPGYTGVAHALIQGGVPSVVAMRYAVGDEYARNLAIELYRALFAHTDPKSVPAALSLARKELLGGQRPDAARFDAADHATPVLYGAENPGLAWVNDRSPTLNTRDSRLHRIAELTIAGHPHFVGRSWELAELGSRFIGAARSHEARPVALVTGLGGMGKTALAAEVLDLWEQRFEWVLLYQAKPNALGFETTLRDIHLRLSSELGRYHEKVKKRPADAIYREADAHFNGAERIGRLTQNLVQALRDEPILLVLDNFESNLKPPVEPSPQDAEPRWICQDPDWDSCLALLANELVGSPSRILITCRHQLAALARDAAAHCLRVRLGPLPAGEAALYLREHAGLSRMLFGKDDAEKDLAERLLKASRFHPLLMDRLARLATGGPELRMQLTAALEAIETNHDATQLSELFNIERGSATELAYLEDALATSIDQLIRSASPEARQLLWMIAVANEPIKLALLLRVWSGEDGPRQKQLRELKELLEMMPLLPQEVQAEAPAVPPELRVAIDALPPKITPRPDPTLILAYIIDVGLATQESTELDGTNPYITCHEVVRERISAWMAEQHLEYHTDLTAKDVWLSYAQSLEEEFQTTQHEDISAALDAGRRALFYYAEAEAWVEFGDLSSEVVTRTEDPNFISALVPYLYTATIKVQGGRLRWKALSNLADALRNGGRQVDSLWVYQQAVTQAQEEAEQEIGTPQTWADVAMMKGNWAGALGMVGDLDASQKQRLESAEAHKKAGSPAVCIISSELEALRIDVMKGRSIQAIPKIESRLALVEAWWKRHKAGQSVPEAPEPEFLARALLGAQNIAGEAYSALENWDKALWQTEAALETVQELDRSADEVAGARMNRAIALSRLGRLSDAQTEMEFCLETFSNSSYHQARVLSSLADLYAEQGDFPQAVLLARRALAAMEASSDPIERALSHNNLACYLEKRRLGTDWDESARHHLAALAYRLAGGLLQDSTYSRRSYLTRIRRIRANGQAFVPLLLAELLAYPAFRPLEEWLHDRGEDLKELQSRVDQFLASVLEGASRGE